MFKSTEGKWLLAVSLLSFLVLLGLQHTLKVSRSLNSPRYGTAAGPGVGSSPEQENPPKELGKRQRLPKALIIGFSKCGTTALRTFLTIHPEIVSPVLELQYFTFNYAKGVAWYRAQMPLSTKRQITLEKTPSYIFTNASLVRIRQFNPKMKLIVIVRDPIVRLQSQYAHVFRNEPEDAPKPSFKAWCRETGTNTRILHFSNYAKYIGWTYRYFPRDQVLVISEEDMEKNPLAVLKSVETFLGLRPLFSKDLFVYNDDKGFYCFNTESKLYPTVLKMVKINPTTGCLGPMKGRKHPDIEEDFRKELVELIRPLNEQLFRLLHKRFKWKNFTKKTSA